MQIVVLIIAVVLNVILFVVALFIGNILMFESIGLGILTGALANNYLGIHPALCLLIGVFTFFTFIFIASTKIGFWVIATLMSFFFALLIAVIVYDSAKDKVWLYVTLGLSFFFILGLHLKFKPA